MKADELKSIDFFYLFDGTKFILKPGFIILREDLMGRIMQNLIQIMNPRRMAQFLVRIGFAIGYNYALYLRNAEDWDSPKEWLKAGFYILENAGLYRIIDLEFSNEDEPDNFMFKVEIEGSFEARIQKAYLGGLMENFAGCWLLSGYFSGYTSAYFRKKIIAQEIACNSRGEHVCVFVGRPKEKWPEDELLTILRVYTGLSLAEELDILYEELRRLNLELREKNRELEMLSNIDDLTQCYNRRYAFKTLERWIEEGRHPLSAIVIDLDGFKDVNDHYGHTFGDSVLLEFAQILKNTVGSAGFVARWGGDEFIAVITGDIRKAAEIAEKIRARVEKHKFPPPVGRGKLTVSVGVAEHYPAEELDSFITRADNALYEAKRRGRNRVYVARL